MSILTAVVAYGVLALVVTALLIGTTTVLQHSINTVIRDTQSQAIVSELELSLLAYRTRASRTARPGRSEAILAQARQVSAMRRLLEQAHRYVGTERERQLLVRLAQELEAYLRARERLEARGVETAQLDRLTAPLLSKALRDVDALRLANNNQVTAARARASRINNIANVAGILSGVVLVLGLVAIVVGLRRHLVQPVLALHQSISALRSGDGEVRVPASGLREITELRQGFEEMARTLSRQRQDQLTFLAGVAHDLRNPLAAIKLGLQALQQQQSDDRRARTGEVLDRQVDRLGRMVEDLLDAARIEAGKLELRCEELDLRGVVADILRLYGPTSPDHQIAGVLPDQPVMVHADPLRIEQVVSNLLSNAIKFSPAGGDIRVGVGTEGDHGVISVEDEGIGIAAEDLEGIFLPFRRQKLSVAPGVGLGLSVVRKIVVAHGGTIEVQSRRGAGSTFRVRLPRATGHGSGEC